MGLHGSRSRSRSPKRQRRDRASSGSPRGRSRSPQRRHSRSSSHSRSPPGAFGGVGRTAVGGLSGYSPTRSGGFGMRFGGGAGGPGGAGRGIASGGPPGTNGGGNPPPWVTNARLSPQVKAVLESLYGRGKLGPGDLEYACIEFLELLGPVGGMAVLEEFASLDFFRIRNLTAFFIGICKRVQARAPPPPGRPLRGPDGGSPPPPGGGSGGGGSGGIRGRALTRGGGGSATALAAAGGAATVAGGGGGGPSRVSRSPVTGAGLRRASPPLHFVAEDSPPLPRRWVSKSPPLRRFESKSPPLRRFSSKSPPLPRRWVSRSPPLRRFDSKSPPPKRWVSRSPPPKRWVSRSPQAKRWVSRSPPRRSRSPQLRRHRRVGSRSRSPPPPPPQSSSQQQHHGQLSMQPPSRRSGSPPPPPSHKTQTQSHSQSHSHSHSQSDQQPQQQHVGNHQLQQQKYHQERQQQSAGTDHTASGPCGDPSKAANNVSTSSRTSISRATTGTGTAAADAATAGAGAGSGEVIARTASPEALATAVAGAAVPSPLPPLPPTALSAPAGPRPEPSCSASAGGGADRFADVALASPQAVAPSPGGATQQLTEVSGPLSSARSVVLAEGITRLPVLPFQRSGNAAPRAASSSFVPADTAAADPTSKAVDCVGGSSAGHGSTKVGQPWAPERGGLHTLAGAGNYATLTQALAAVPPRQEQQAPGLPSSATSGAGVPASAGKGSTLDVGVAASLMAACAGALAPDAIAAGGDAAAPGSAVALVPAPSMQEAGLVAVVARVSPPLAVVRPAPTEAGALGAGANGGGGGQGVNQAPALGDQGVNQIPVLGGRAAGVPSADHVVDAHALFDPAALMDSRMNGALLSLLPQSGVPSAGSVSAAGSSAAAAVLVAPAGCTLLDGPGAPLPPCPLGGWLAVDMDPDLPALPATPVAAAAAGRLDAPAGAAAAAATGGLFASAGPQHALAAEGTGGKDATGAGGPGRHGSGGDPARGRSWVVGGLSAQVLEAAVGASASAPVAMAGIGSGEGSVLRQAVTEHVKEALKPAWRSNKLTRETFKAVAKKAVDRVLLTLLNNGVGSMYDCPSGVASFFSDARKEAISGLVEAMLASM